MELLNNTVHQEVICSAVNCILLSFNTSVLDSRKFWDQKSFIHVPVEQTCCIK